jgi:branched-chain amino acid transport system permease protein
MLMLAMFGVFFLLTKLGVDPYASLLVMVPAMFALGYLLYRGVIGRFSGGKDENILLITLGLSILIENLALMFFKGDTRTISVAYSDKMVELGPLLISLPKIISFVAAMVLCAVLGLWMQRSDTGKAIRAVAKERMGARLVGIDVDRVFAISYGIGLATLGAAACLLMPIFYVSPTIGHVFVIVAFTVVVLGGMGSFLGAVVGGLIVGLTESFGGLFLGESLGQIGISLIFILILLLRPSGLFGAGR